MLFNNIDTILENAEVSWDNCVGIGLDNTAVNLGRRNSIMTRVLGKNASIYVNGCPCHIIHNTASKAADSFSKQSGFDVEDMLVDLFHWFDKSSKRKVQIFLLKNPNETEVVVSVYMTKCHTLALPFLGTIKRVINKHLFVVALFSSLSSTRVYFVLQCALLFTTGDTNLNR